MNISFVEIIAIGLTGEKTMTIHDCFHLIFYCFMVLVCQGDINVALSKNPDFTHIIRAFVMLGALIFFMYKVFRLYLGVG